MTSISIRPALHSDCDDAFRLEQESFGATAYPATFFIQAVDIHGPGFLLAEIDQAAVGFIVSARVADINEHAWIINLAVATAVRRQGIAMALISAIVDYRRRQNCRTLFLTVSDKNAPAIELYRKVGFEKCGTHPARFSDGKDRLLFGLKC